jgi:hypothetical protein
VILMLLLGQLIKNYVICLKSVIIQSGITIYMSLSGREAILNSTKRSIVVGCVLCPTISGEFADGFSKFVRRQKNGRLSQISMMHGE